MPITIRPVRVEDAEAVLDLFRALDEETKFMMLEPGERKTTFEEERNILQRILNAGNSMLFVAEDSGAGKLAGLLGAQGGSFRRNHDTVHIFIGVRQAYAGQGVGRRLFEALEAWAVSWNAHRLELTVMVHNQRAIALYNKMGFVIEGRLCGTLKVDGEYVDEYMMSKILK